MLPRCSLLALPSALELTLRYIDNQDSAVGLCRPSDHIRNEVAMARSVQDGEVAIWCLEMACCHFDRHSSLLLLFCLVHDVCELETCLVIELGLAFICPQLLPGHVAAHVEDFT